jgi:SAM-dependent methyltransferase
MAGNPGSADRGRPGSPARDFESSYAGTPPWDIGRPQPTFAALAQAGRITGRVLDAGCGTGEHALMAARLDLDTVGIDFAPSAIARAQQKAAGTGLPVQFVVGDILALPSMAEVADGFDTVLDSGLFHVFDDPDRAMYVQALHAVLRPGGRLLLMCFSDREPGTWGPRRVTEPELRTSFADGWRIDAITPSTFDIVAGNSDMPSKTNAWLVECTRV